MIPRINKIIYFSDRTSSQYKDEKTLLTYVTIKTILVFMQNETFLHHHTEKMHTMELKAQLKREVTKASIQRPFNDYILTAEYMFEYCQENIKGITYMYVKNEDIFIHKEELEYKFNNCE